MKSIIGWFKSESAERQIVFKVLGTAVSAAALLLPATAVHSGEGGESALESVALLTFETGSTDQIALYIGGELGGDTESSPDVQQIVVDEDKNKCELDQTDAATGLPLPDRLLLIGVEPESSNVGFVGDSMGVFSRGGGGGNARGTKCGRISDDEKLILTVGSFDSDGDTVPDVNAVVKTSLDIEFKQNAIAIFTAKVADTITGQFWISTGTNSDEVPIDLDPIAVEAGGAGCDALTGSDTNNDSGPNDNCHVTFDALWTSLEIEVQAGQISLEGGGDYGTLANRSEFELVQADGIINCQEGFISSSSDEGEDAIIQGARLNNVGGQCGALVPFSIDFDGENIQLLFEPGGQDTTWVLNTEWQIERQAEGAELPPTLVSWEAGVIDWDTCADDDPGPATCFAVERCDVGEPVRRCSNTLASCAIDADCVDAEGSGSCELIDIEAPADGFPSTSGEVGQYACLCEQTETWLGTWGRDGEEGGGDDTAPDNYSLVQQCLFLEGDIRWNR